MQELINEIYETIKSSRITNVKDSIDDIIYMLRGDEVLQEEIQRLLSKEDILWFNKNNSEIFFTIPEEQSYSSNKKLDLAEEIKWVTQAISSSEQINWDSIKYRYKKALKLLGTKDVIYYTNIKEMVAIEHQDRWRYLNE